MLGQTGTGVGTPGRLAAHDGHREPQQDPGDGRVHARRVHSIHTATASGSSSHQERIRRWTAAVNSASGTAAPSSGRG